MMMRDCLCSILLLLSLGVLSSAQTTRLPTAAEQQEALDAHNQARAETAVEQRVENMPELVWNQSLAEIGLTYLQSSNCYWGHNSNRGSTGENIAAGHASFHAAIYDSWYASEEEAYFTGSGVDGHYTQVTWTRTLTVGCAWCSTSSAGFGPYYICNYYPAGNFNGQEPYESGSGACQSCPAGQTCTTTPFEGLCSTNAGQPTPEEPTPQEPSPTDAVTTAPEEPTPEEPTPEEPTPTTEVTDAVTPATATPEEPTPEEPTPEEPSPTEGGCGAARSGFQHQDGWSTLDFAFTSDPQTCCDFCNDNAACQGWTASPYVCFIYDTPVDFTVAASGYTSGNKAQSAPLGSAAIGGVVGAGAVFLLGGVGGAAYYKKRKGAKGGPRNYSEKPVEMRDNITANYARRAGAAGDLTPTTV